ncbi:UNKNOWN [Stylonychia lemnae]|uniref:DUF1232 domain-containing protein n=1 Tax=Stylonychia lemnae TaxID=5949 RepID=A0A078A242_STYLE|nr:UNKNOWN [Stylonychia lemnae]|eukprot:CDW75568.1 UNKNOWN [Stylonychia lemnae]
MAVVFPSVRNGIKRALHIIVGSEQAEQINRQNENQREEDERAHAERFQNARDQKEYKFQILTSILLVALFVLMNQKRIKQHQSGCIVSYWKAKRENKIQCPYCRRDISLLLMKDPTKVEIDDRRDIQRFNTLFSADRTFLDRIRDFPFLIARFRDELVNTRGGVLFQSSWFLIYIAIMVIYLISPFDLIPEFLFGIFGMIDDILVMIYILGSISTVFYQVLVNRNRQEVRAR